MSILVTGSAGHLGEALMRTLQKRSILARGIDLKQSPFTNMSGSLSDRAFVARAMEGIDTVLHTATLHKPHVVTHTRQDFVDTNITGTLNLLEECRTRTMKAFVFTSTTSTFGDAMRPQPGGPAVWVDEDVVPITKNIYGVTKLAAENLCRLAHTSNRLPTIILRTSRFFPEDDDAKTVRQAYSMENAKVNELLARRADIADVVSAHLCAAERARDIGYGMYIVSATPPFTRNDLQGLTQNAPDIVERHVPFKGVYEKKGWSMFPAIERVYDNSRARKALGWEPALDFSTALNKIEKDQPIFSLLTDEVGKKGYHDEVFEDGPFPVE